MKITKFFRQYLVGSIILLLLLPCINLRAQDFSDLEFGTDTTLEIVTWNIEWFPKNGQTTVNDVSLILDAMDADLIAVQEIDDKTVFSQMIDALDGWNAYFLYGEYNSLAYIYKEETVELIDVYEIFSEEWRVFPRSPLVIEFLYKGDAFIVINNHLKCCGDGILDLLDDWDEEKRRYDACNMMEDFIQTSHPDDRVILTGDLNDILTDIPANNVFNVFLEQPEAFLFADMDIAQGSISQWSYPNWPSHLDHLLISDELFDIFSAEGSEVQTIRLDDYYSGGMGEYDDRVSDHRPVGLKLAFPEVFGTDDRSLAQNQIKIYPNPANNSIRIKGWNKSTSDYRIFTTSGKEVMSGTHIAGETIDISHLRPGLYFMSLKSENGSKVMKLVKK
ncbi:MAG: T9SS type A sorting domain-containing protein [Bacteroidales bacterium]|nr:T9SS type A sorting domain-containing protein [Bacteroidales bacterium]